MGIVRHGRECLGVVPGLVRRPAGRNSDRSDRPCFQSERRKDHARWRLRLRQLVLSISLAAFPLRVIPRFRPRLPSGARHWAAMSSRCPRRSQEWRLGRSRQFSRQLRYQSAWGQQPKRLTPNHAQRSRPSRRGNNRVPWGHVAAIDVHRGNASKAGAKDAEMAAAVMIATALRAGATVAHATHPPSARELVGHLG
jgi:hypothetical protein